MLDAAPRPDWTPLWLICNACGYWWDDWQPTNVPVATWIAHTKALHCPDCGKGSKSLLLRTKPLPQKPPHA